MKTLKYSPIILLLAVLAAGLNSCEKQRPGAEATGSLELLVGLDDLTDAGLKSFIVLNSSLAVSCFSSPPDCLFNKLPRNDKSIFVMFTNTFGWNQKIFELLVYES